MTEITDEMCRRALEAMTPDRIQGFSTRGCVPGTWGPPHTVRDVWLSPSQQELWRGNDHSEMVERCRIEEMRLALQAAYGQKAGVDQK